MRVMRWQLATPAILFAILYILYILNSQTCAPPVPRGGLSGAFHGPCIDRWLSEHRACPLCKQEVRFIRDPETGSIPSNPPAPRDGTFRTGLPGPSVLVSDVVVPPTPHSRWGATNRRYFGSRSHTPVTPVTPVPPPTVGVEAKIPIYYHSYA